MCADVRRWPKRRPIARDATRHHRSIGPNVRRRPASRFNRLRGRRPIRGMRRARRAPLARRNGRLNLAGTRATSSVVSPARTDATARRPGRAHAIAKARQSDNASPARRLDARLRRELNVARSQRAGRKRSSGIDRPSLRSRASRSARRNGRQSAPRHDPWSARSSGHHSDRPSRNGARPNAPSTLKTTRNAARSTSSPKLHRAASGCRSA